MKQVTRLKCDNCETGVVKLVVKEKRSSIEAYVEDCDACKKSFGLKSITKLKKLDIIPNNG